MAVVTRFAPSPTGQLHIGSARIALLNFLFAKSRFGRCILRIDDSDKERSKDEYTNAIISDLHWLGLDFDSTFKQSSIDRIARYESAKNYLISIGRLYPCFETEEELSAKRNIAIANNKPFIYDRSALQLTQDTISKYHKTGVSPHYRFMIDHEPIAWHDMIKGEIHYHGSHISDPVVVKQDGTMTYLLASVIDDIDYNITHIIRGEDHVTNTATQQQMFDAMGHTSPIFGHIGLMKAKNGKISKRIGGYEISSLAASVHPMAVCSFLTLLGSSKPMMPHLTPEALLQQFDIGSYSRNSSYYEYEEISAMNDALEIRLPFPEIAEMCAARYNIKLTKQFWEIAKSNISKIEDIKTLWNASFHLNPILCEDPNFIVLGSTIIDTFLRSELSLDKWIHDIMIKCNIAKKVVLRHLRLAITGLTHGPEMRLLIPMIGQDMVLSRLQYYFGTEA